MAIRLLSIFCAAALLAAPGCDSGSSGDGTGGPAGKADELNPDGPFACDDLIEDESGRGLEHGFLQGRTDPIAQLVLKAGDACPTTYHQMMDKLRRNDAEGCSQDDPKAGIATMAVSERSQRLETAESYRLAVTRACDGRPKWQMYFSLFGVSATAQRLPRDVEVIAFDDTTKLFNYYALERGQWKFFGDSTDMVRPDATNRCASCHTGGGLVMKELDTPWVHWEGHLDIPGADELVDAHDDLGSKSSGSTMESNVKAGNRVWNETRVRFWESLGDFKELLRPLFCTVEVNLDNGSDFKDSKLTSIKADALLDPHLKSFGSISGIDHDAYIAELEAIGQLVEDGGGDALEDGEGNEIRDTIFAFVYPERAHADNDYVDKLKAAELIDDDFLTDALMVDFTNPIFSGARCGLLEFAPEELETLDAASLRAGFVANLEAADPADGSAAATFLAHLKDTEDADAHKAAVDAFWSACDARDKDDFMKDVLRVTVMRRDIARGLHVFEFAETMPVADISVDEGTRLNPETCELEIAE